MILEQIVAHKKKELVERKQVMPLAFLETRLPDSPPARNFTAALRRPGRVAIIAEAKKASPSKGILRQSYNPVELAVQYQGAGAAAVSILTEEKFFLGHPSHLAMVREAVHLPLLRKDFIIDPYQIYESLILGADAVLLIASILTDEELAQLKALAEGMGMSCLVEVHTEEELDRALAAGAEMIGINNRDLKIFKTDLTHTFRLAELIDRENITVVSESGIKDHNDILRLLESGIHAALVGEALSANPFPGRALLKLAGPGLRKNTGEQDYENN
ncbi:Indole-3-glycerol phosphate synthase [Pelotomaculum schinkii]|uniref:Indole-3-glycerol phosphate synthase n=1 Tax=Pelotomaculum schinkii TaxID=78350 RepID=A0A4Y7R8M6_9FIRM|nr:MULTISPECIES: indole-3-glycerol phosphate synthase TrpC [Pelotomaculum]TEB05325.1 Indole-3-glycerol phosphate synthase [Pelotomaculum schinkii]TEB17348.1 Indole-3-glycerol phosphate synthase [Pelotomaculum sp. FP]